MQADIAYSRRGLLSFFRLLTCLVAVPAFAQTAPPDLPAPPAAVQPAQLDEILVKEGYHTAEFLQHGGDLSGALSVLRMTYERVKTPVLLWPIAQLSAQLRQPLLGLQALSDYARRVPPREMEAGRQMADVTLLRGQLLSQISRLTVVTDEPGALVMIDGQQHGRTPLQEPLQLDPGRRRVEARGSRSVVREVSLWPGKESTVSLRLAPQKKRRVLSALKWTAAGVGLAGVVAGGVAWGLGSTSGPAEERTAGGALLIAGAGLLGVAVILFAVDRPAP